MVLESVALIRCTCPALHTQKLAKGDVGQEERETGNGKGHTDNEIGLQCW